jgi:hypothetical protein
MPVIRRPERIGSTPCRGPARWEGTDLSLPSRVSPELLVDDVESEQGAAQHRLII